MYQLNVDMNDLVSKYTKDIADNRDARIRDAFRKKFNASIDILLDFAPCDFRNEQRNDLCHTIDVLSWCGEPFIRIETTFYNKAMEGDDCKQMIIGDIKFQEP